MAINVFLPAKMNSEKNRFKLTKGNVKIDYRDTTNITEPYLLSTPYLRIGGGVELDVAPPIVLQDTPVTGDPTDYRRFGTDIMFQVENYQTNAVFLLADSIIFEVEYKQTEFVKTNSEMLLSHIFIINSTNKGQNSFRTISPLSLKTSVTDIGLIDKVPTTIFKKDNSLFTGSTFLDSILDPEELPLAIIQYEEETLIDLGDTGQIVDEASIPSHIKELTLFSASLANPSFKYTLHFVSSFNNTGSKLNTTNPSVLTDNLPNYTLYSKTITTDPDIVGFTLNLSPEIGALCHVTVETSSENLTTQNIGKTVFYYNPMYTGELSSEFGLFSIQLPDIAEELTLEVDGIPKLLGSFKTGDTTLVVEALSKVLTPLGVSIFECEGGCFILDNSSQVDYEFGFISTSIALVLKTDFTEFKFPNQVEPVTYDKDYHKKNYSFSHIPSKLEASEDSVLDYRLKLSKNTRSTIKYVDASFNLLIKAELVANQIVTLPVKVDGIESDIIVTIEDTDTTVEAILSKFVIALSESLGADFTVIANNLASFITVSNADPLNAHVIVLGKADWYSVDTKKGVLQNTSDNMYQVKLIPADGG